MNFILYTIVILRYIYIFANQEYRNINGCTVKKALVVSNIQRGKRKKKYIPGLETRLCASRAPSTKHGANGVLVAQNGSQGSKTGVGGLKWMGLSRKRVWLGVNRCRWVRNG